MVGASVQGSENVQDLSAITPSSMIKHWERTLDDTPSDMWRDQGKNSEYIKKIWKVVNKFKPLQLYDHEMMKYTPLPRLVFSNLFLTPSYFRGAVPILLTLFERQEKRILKFQWTRLLIFPFKWSNRTERAGHLKVRVRKHDFCDRRR